MRRKYRFFATLIISIICSHYYLNDTVSRQLLPRDSRSSATTNTLGISSKTLQHDINNFDNPLEKTIAVAQSKRFDLPPPIFGEHNPASDAVLVFAYGYKPPAILRFVESLVKTGYDGDIVLGIDYDKLIKSLEEGQEEDGTSEAVAFQRYLEQRAAFYHLVVYNVKLKCEPDNPTLCTAPYMYQIRKSRDDDTSNGDAEYLRDPRIARSVKLLRYEYYWAWSTNYVEAAAGRIFVSDLRDVYFQQNPFTAAPFSSQDLSSTAAISRDEQQTALQVFVEDTSKFEIATQTSNARWIRTTKGEKVLEEIGHNPIVCSGTTLGGAVAMESYLRAIIEEFDSTQCDLDGCDQGLHNYLLYSGRLLLHDQSSTTLSTAKVTDPVSGKLALKVVEHNTESTPKVNNQTKQRINRIEFFSQGYGPVHTLGLFCGFGEKGVLRKRGLLRDDKEVASVVLNWDGMITPVVHQIDRCREISSDLESYGDLLWKLWAESSTELMI